jgi:flagellar motor switch protein FliN/FliY
MSEQTEHTDVNGGGEDGAQDAPQAAAAGAGDGAEYERAAFQELGEEAGASRKGETSLDVILDIPVTLSMEIGRSKLSIQNLLQLARGSVVELDRMAGEPLDVLVNGTLVAHGEVVVVNDKFGVRLSDVVSPAERVNTLK